VGPGPHDLAAILTDNGHIVRGADALPDPLDRADAAVTDAEHTARSLGAVSDRTTTQADVVTDAEIDAEIDADDAANADVSADVSGGVDRWWS
jgi:hypothetical protein